MPILTSHIIEHAGRNYVPWKLGLKYPKMVWVIYMLDQYGIPHLVRGEMLYVQQGSIEICSEILEQPLAEFEAVVVADTDKRPTEILIRIDDLPNDHPFFEAQLEGRVIRTPQPEAYVAPEAPTPPLISHEFPTKDEIEYAVDSVRAEGPDEFTANADGMIVPEAEEDDDDWGFDEDDLNEDGPIIDIEHKVIETDSEFVAEDAPAPVEKPKKAKPEPKEAIDPDFDAASESPTNPAAVLDGTEFRRVDEVLPFEDVILPDVQNPIRMYDVMSSNVSAIGHKALEQNPLVVTFYARFKPGDTVYRYNPVAKSDAHEAYNLAVRKVEGVQEASVGSFIYHTIRDKAEEGLIKCQRLYTDDKGTRWVKVVPKSERTKATKERAKKT